MSYFYAGFVNLQSVTSGTQQIGNFNISGTGLVGTSFGINSSTPGSSFSLNGTSGINPFSVNSSTGASMLSILQNGNVGIGIANPANQLEVSGLQTGNTANIRAGDLVMQSYAVNNSWIGENIYGVFQRREAGYSGLFYFTAGGGQFRFDNTGAPNDAVGAHAQEKMYYDGSFALGGVMNTTQTDYRNGTIVGLSTGQVGIGTSTPLAFLSVMASSSNGGSPIFEVASSSGTSFLRVLSSGNVGIGTTTPPAKLTVQGTGITSTTQSFEESTMPHLLFLRSLRRRFSNNQRRRG